MLPKTRRLTRRDLKQVMRLGRQIKTPQVYIKYFRNKLNFSRFAVVISNKVLPRAHDRNRLKRLIYTSLIYPHTSFMDTVIGVFPSVVNLSDEVLCSEINQVLSQISLGS